MATEENELERALRVAAKDPASRPDFYRLLIDSQVHVLGETGQPAPGAKTLAAGETISIQNWTGNDGGRVIPFFTSLAALQRAIPAERNYLTLAARSLFEMTKGSRLVLNPKSDYGKEFFPNEIEALIASGVNQLPETRVMQKETKVLIGQPAQYPTRMVESLRRFFATRRQVRAAYLAWMHDPAHDAKPHLVIGILAEGDFAPLSRETGAIASDLATPGEPVDVFRVVRGDAGLSKHMLGTVKPFFRRSWATTIKDLFRMQRG